MRRLSIYFVDGKLIIIECKQYWIRDGVLYVVPDDGTTTYFPLANIIEASDKGGVYDAID